ncbi:hypothetical protein DD237_005049 [Peronospora effusa]|uniref:N-acetyltransferase domain-containing protein n=1 Tax=Peronospora effusa TaxID=542832 RepID=A0A425CAG9_9STRA|nr:hypothetical protein DD237_005049 [Peronospora effusa]
MTASEPLSIEDELEMQKSWRDDDKSTRYKKNCCETTEKLEFNKCTFIVLANAEGDGRPEASYIDENALDRMAGDVNLFFNDHDDPHACEVEIMIAEEKYRRNGFAEEAVKLMMAYATSKLKVNRFFCKIIETNSASLQLFEK